MEELLDNGFLLFDRITKIKSVQEQSDLEHNAYISFSGGKDSTVLSSIFDMALPGNTIPRVFINTGIKMQGTLKFVRSRTLLDPRIVIYNSCVNIKDMLETYGYPMKSKLHSEYLESYRRNDFKYKSTRNYYNGLTKEERKAGKSSKFFCSLMYRYQFSPDFKLKCSAKCCKYLKKGVAKRWEKENGRSIPIVGIRADEGGVRSLMYNKEGGNRCIWYDKDGKANKFAPLMPMTDAFINYVVEEHNIELSPLYSPPYNFDRTGCRGCPFAPRPILVQNLEVMKQYLPIDFKAAIKLWEPVYREYIRISALPKSNIINWQTLYS